MVGMGFVKNWSGLMAARFFLGVTEAGLFPGVNYFISCWYKRDEFAVRAVSLHTTAFTCPLFSSFVKNPWFRVALWRPVVTIQLCAADLGHH